MIQTNERTGHGVFDLAREKIIKTHASVGNVKMPAFMTNTQLDIEMTTSESECKPKVLSHQQLNLPEDTDVDGNSAEVEEGNGDAQSEFSNSLVKFLFKKCVIIFLLFLVSLDRVKEILGIPNSRVTTPKFLLSTTNPSSSSSPISRDVKNKFPRHSTLTDEEEENAEPKMSE